jgi:hypothetical protein
MDQALSHEIKEKLQAENDKKLEAEKQKLNEKAREWQASQMAKLKEKAKEEMDLQLKDKSNELEETKKQNKALQEQLLELNKLMRQIKSENETKRLEMEKRLTEAEDKIRIEEKKKIDEEYKLKILEKDKKLDDALKMVEEYKRKLEQGSQQLQGEVLELELENTLKRDFPYDEIREVPKGVRGADIQQVVRNSFGREVGTIVWELKRTKAWSEGWISKLKEDQRTLKADLAVIVSQVLPAGVVNFAPRSEGNEVWVCDYQSMMGLAIVLRDTLLKISAVKQSVVGKQDKKEILWNYLTGIEFKQRLDAVNEAIIQREEILAKEQKWFTNKWAAEKKSLELLKNNLIGMHGDLQGIMGKSMPEMEEMRKLEEGI